MLHKQSGLLVMHVVHEVGQKLRALHSGIPQNFCLCFLAYCIFIIYVSKVTLGATVQSLLTADSFSHSPYCNDLSAVPSTANFQLSCPITEAYKLSWNFSVCI